MSLDITEFEELSVRDQRRKCKTGALLEKLSADERELLTEALASPGRVTIGGIVKWVEKRGHQISVPSVSYHRAGKCRCHAAA